MPDLSKREKIDRIAIVITYDNKEKLLGIPKTIDGTGNEMAKTIFKVLQEWKIESQVKIACFDTTSANTGSNKGSAILLEQL